MYLSLPYLMFVPQISNQSFISKSMCGQWGKEERRKKESQRERERQRVLESESAFLCVCALFACVCLLW